MMEREPVGESRSSFVLRRWRHFWFEPEPAYSLGLVRIAFGALGLAWALALFPDLFELFGEQAVVPQQLSANTTWGIFDLWHTDAAVLAAWIVLIIAGAALTVGWHSRIAAVVVFVLIRSFIVRTPQVFNYGDSVIAAEAMFLAVASCGAALSLDQRRQTGTFWSAQTRAPWVIRLFQVQLSLIYVSTFVAKLIGKTWADGSAVSYAWQTAAKSALVPVPEWITSNPLLINVVTWGTMLIEIAIVILVWSPRWRLKVLLVGVLLHLAIMMNIAVGFFSLAMFVLYLAFVPWQVAERLPDTVRACWSRSVRRTDDGSSEHEQANPELVGETPVKSPSSADASPGTTQYPPEPPPRRTAPPTAQ